MKQIFTILFCALGGFFFAQSNFTVFNNSGQQFYVILNGIKQNSIPQTNVSVSGVKNGGYSVKLIFADGKTPDIDKNFMIDSPMDITTKVTFKKGKGKLQLVSMEPTAGSVVNGSVIYRQDNTVIYSDAPIVNVQTPPNNTTITTTQTVPTNVNGNIQVNETQSQSQTNMNTSNQNMNGNLNMNVGINGNVGVNGTTSTNGQNGNVNMNTNVNTNGMNVSVNDPVTGENISLNMNIGFNTNGTNTTVSDPLMNNGNLNMNVNVNGGNGIQTSNTTSTVTTTSSQTINGQTTFQSGTTTTQNNNGNVAISTNSTPNMNSNSNTTISTPNNQTQSNTVVSNGKFINCNKTLLNTDEFIQDIKSQTFEADRIDIIYKDLAKICVSSSQVFKILETITFEQSKYEVAQFLYYRTTDRQNLDKGMLPLFTFDSTKMDWREFVRNNQ